MIYGFGLDKGLGVTLKALVGQSFSVQFPDR